MYVFESGEIKNNEDCHQVCRLFCPCVVSSDVQELGLNLMVDFLYGLKTEVTGEGELWLLTEPAC